MPDFQIGIKIDNSQALIATRGVNAQLARLRLEAEAGAVAQEVALTKSAAVQKKALEDVGKFGVGSLTSMAVAAGVTGFALNKLVDLARGLGQALESAAAKQQAMTRAFGDQRDKLAELAAIQGKTLDNQFTLDFGKFQKATGLRADEALGFQTSFYNSGAQFIGKNISEREATQLQLQSGGLAVARGLQPGLVGDLTGGLLGFTDYQGKFGDQSSEQILGTVFRIFQGLGRGRGENATLIKDTTAILAASANEDALKGVFQKPEEVAALVSTIAEAKPAEAEVYTRATLKALRSFDDKKAGPLLARAGLTPQGKMPIEEQADRLAAVLNEESRKEQVPLQDVVARYFADVREQIGVATLVNKGAGPRGALRDRLDFMKGFGTPEALADTARFQASEPGAARIVEADVRLAEAERGAENSKIDIIRREALANLTRSKRIATPSSELQDFLVQTGSFGLVPNAERLRVDEEARAILGRRREAAGLKPFALPERSWQGGWAGPNVGSEIDDPNDELNRNIREIQGAGANPLVDPEVKGLLRKVTTPPPLAAPHRPLDGAPQRP